MKIFSVINYFGNNLDLMTWLCLRQAGKEHQSMNWSSSWKKILSHEGLMWSTITPMMKVRLISWFTLKSKSTMWREGNRRTTSSLICSWTKCSNTLTVYPDSKKIHHLDGIVAPPKFFVHPEIFKLYKNNYSTTNIINHFWKGGLNWESSI